MFLALSRLMDSAKTRVKGGTSENLSLQNLIQEYQLESDPDISEKFKKIESIYKATNINEYRKKTLVTMIKT